MSASGPTPSSTWTESHIHSYLREPLRHGQIGRAGSRTSSGWSAGCSLTRACERRSSPVLYDAQTSTPYLFHSSLWAVACREAKHTLSTSTDCIIGATSRAIHMGTPRRVSLFLLQFGRTGRRAGSAHSRRRTRPQIRRGTADAVGAARAGCASSDGVGLYPTPEHPGAAPNLEEAAPTLSSRILHGSFEKARQADS